MKNKILYIFLLVALCIVGIGFWKGVRAHKTSAVTAGSYLTSWNPKMAASYLDEREVWWQYWPPAKKDHGTICISCHTTVPYALARPALQQKLGQTEMPAAEKTMLDSVEKRVSQWSEMIPFYSDAAYGPGKTAESHATEAVLNAVILASYDAGQGHLRPITRSAFNEAWALQEETGADAGGWKWQNFHLAPWESPESGYQGAALLAVALGNTPDQYTAEPGAGKHVEQLQAYLQRQYETQPLMSQLYVLWASARMPGLMNEAERTRLLAEVGNLQRTDGGWALSSLNKQAGWNWKWLDNTSESDGCATGLVVLALEESGISRQDKMLERGVEWLKQHQEKNGSWRATSLNMKRDPESNIGRFMSDAATGYAVLALDSAQTDTERAALSK
ncbi:MAG TPA: hypothetical protein VHX63_05630 [Acidobacteriaceae bacterium]|jgi:hypothetical protein|nr:hypothetical protein [Acidobacteriaceae bacterium]